MGIRIQPREIEIPEDDPFKNNLLGRKESVEVITHLMGSIEGPCVLAVDAPWGTGKTTFLNIWIQYLRNNNFPVVKFNAWESDFTEDPFVAIAAELSDGLQHYIPMKHRAKISTFKKAAAKVLLRTASSAIEAVTHGIVDIAGIIENRKEESYAEARISRYQETQHYVKDFKKSLQDIADTVQNSSEGLPLIVIIDELDRCRPSYAVELLEVAKHLFAVDKIVFVLAINRSELAHSIKVVYGSDFDAEGYLRRFFDIDFRLPEPEREKFTRAMLDAVQLKDYFDLTIDSRHRGEEDLMHDLLLKFFSTSGFSLRKIAQAIHRFGLVYGSLANDQPSFVPMAIVTLILRTFDSERYYRFIRHEISDTEIVGEILSRFSTNTVGDGHRDQHMSVVFAASVIVAGTEGRYDDREALWPFSTPLLDQYKQVVLTEPTSPHGIHARDVIELVDRYGPEDRSDMREAFKHAVKRLELLSPSLISGHPDSNNSAQ